MVRPAARLVALSAILAAARGLGQEELLPIDDESLMPSAEEVAASLAGFDERARAAADGGAAAWDAKLRAASALADSRRRTQEERATGKYDSAALSGGTELSWPEAMTEPAAAGCADEVAENAGAAQELCRYDCATLKERFLPDAPPEKTRCFLYDPVSATWPDEMLSMRKQTQDWHTCEFLHC